VCQGAKFLPPKNSVNKHRIGDDIIYIPSCQALFQIFLENFGGKSCRFNRNSVARKYRATENAPAVKDYLVQFLGSQ